jgi:hypothetical protein
MRMRAQQAATDIRKEFLAAGFELQEGGKSPQSFEVRKNNCSQTVERDSKRGWALQGPPLFAVRGVKCELEDHGYQKFWYHQGKRFPIRLNDLKTLHRFDEEVRYILGFRSLYNESLGSTSARSVYDRMRGRPDQ